MKWVKHSTSITRDDVNVAMLLTQGGLEAYGFYWRVIEIIGEQLKIDEAGNVDTSVTLPVQSWCNLLGIRQQKLRRLLILNRFNFAYQEENSITLLKVLYSDIMSNADEYTARLLKEQAGKSLKCRESIGSVSRECLPKIKENKIKENKIKEDIRSSETDEQLSKPLSLKEEKKDQEHKIEQFFDQFWEAYPRKVGKQQARKKFTSLLKEVFKKGTVERTLANLEAHLQKYLSSVQGADPKYIKHPATWLNSEDFTESPEEDSVVKDEKKLIPIEEWG